MKKTSKILVDEHKNILTVVGILEKECDKLEDSRNIDKDFFVKSIEFIRNYADKFHHSKEEEILFKELCKEEVQEKLHCNPIEQMLHEHDVGRIFIKNLEEGVNENDVEKALENARAYISLIREHIFKEDNILYPMGDDAISNEEEKKMLKKFKDVEEGLKDQKEKCLNILGEFKKRK